MPHRMPGRVAAAMLHEGEVVMVLLVAEPDGRLTAAPANRRRTGLSHCMVVDRAVYPGRISMVTGKRYPRRHVFKLRASDDGRVYTMWLGGGATVALAEV